MRHMAFCDTSDRRTVSGQFGYADHESALKVSGPATGQNRMWSGSGTSAEIEADFDGRCYISTRFVGEKFILLDFLACWENGDVDTIRHLLPLRMNRWVCKPVVLNLFRAMTLFDVQHCTATPQFYFLLVCIRHIMQFGRRTLQRSKVSCFV